MHLRINTIRGPCESLLLDWQLCQRQVFQQKAPIRAISYIHAPAPASQQGSRQTQLLRADEDDVISGQGMSSLWEVVLYRQQGIIHSVWWGSSQRSGSQDMPNGSQGMPSALGMLDIRHQCTWPLHNPAADNGIEGLLTPSGM